MRKDVPISPRLYPVVVNLSIEEKEALKDVMEAERLPGTQVIRRLIWQRALEVRCEQRAICPIQAN